MERCKTIILCGGKGTRLKDLGRETPKALMELHGRPILYHKFRHGLNQGFTDYVLAIGHLGDMIREAVAGMGLDARVDYSDSGVNAGMLRRVYDAAGRADGRALVTYGDSIANIEFDRLLDFHKERNSLLTIVTAPIQSPFGLVSTDPAGRVTALDEKPVLHYYIGTFVMEQAALDFIPRHVLDWPDGSGLIAFFKILMAVDRLHAFVYEGPEITFNTVEELSAANDSFLKFHTHFQ